MTQIAFSGLLWSLMNHVPKESSPISGPHWDFDETNENFLQCLNKILQVMLPQLLFLRAMMNVFHPWGQFYSELSYFFISDHMFRLQTLFSSLGLREQVDHFLSRKSLLQLPS